MTEADQPKFVVLDDSNSVVVTMNDNEGRALTEEVVTLNDVKAITYAVLCYLRKHGFRPDRVGYTVEPIAVWRAKQPKK